MKGKSNLLYRSLLISLIFCLAVFGIAQAAGSVVLRNYQVDFLEVILDGDNSTWVYAVTADGNEDAGLSHWTLELGLLCGYTIVAPPESSPNTRTYTTPESYVLQTGENAGQDVCSDIYNCQAASYSVGYGNDATSQLTGIKFEDPDIQLSGDNPVTHIFIIELQKEGEHRIGDTRAAIKAGGGPSGIELGWVTGPVCSPNSVDLLSFRPAVGGFLSSRMALLLASASLIAVGGMWMALRMKPYAS